ncbi:cytochrome c biogenesis protein CcsA [Caldalkalibacillus thermarum TA2.A1]|uniref:Heme exporter protein C n=1 Tax=Caldalkalibacillus thermarum (strain TA2.A1) TaxID=986075 RepID=A0A8X8IBA3_CALTT|nr:cytochrome c biogenesis protein CcsA [Caldalkalibacillus thermarum]QZT35038.1 cytochrome c biogenesis protein CcsA [Caldalkalibacillus thermarum TA2.A1]
MNNRRGAAQRALALLAFVLGIAALYMMFVYAPTERNMGDVQRIMYAHVASAWVAYLSFILVAFSSVLYLWKRKLKWDHLAQASAELGVLFTSLLLITGSLWGRPVWNTWWVWDLRLTTTLILWFVYVGYLLFRQVDFVADIKRTVVSIYGIMAFINIPLVHYSVKWWRSIHPNTITHEGIQMPDAMIYTLAVTSVFFLILYSLLLLYRWTLISQREQVYQLKQQLSKYIIW